MYLIYTFIINIPTWITQFSFLYFSLNIFLCFQQSQKFDISLHAKCVWGFFLLLLPLALSFFERLLSAVSILILVLLGVKPHGPKTEVRTRLWIADSQHSGTDAADAKRKVYEPNCFHLLSQIYNTSRLAFIFICIILSLMACPAKPSYPRPTQAKPHPPPFTSPTPATLAHDRNQALVFASPPLRISEKTKTQANEFSAQPMQK